MIAKLKDGGKIGFRQRSAYFLQLITLSVAYSLSLDLHFLLDSLKIGDYILLRDLSAGVFLAVEGILNDDIGGMADIDTIHDAIFCVHLQRQYSASRELNAFLQKHGMDSGNVTEVNELNYLKALEVSIKINKLIN